MAHIILTPQAREDLFSMWTYIAERDQTAADALIRRIDEVLQMLVSRPGMGSNQQQYRAGLRCFPVGSYLLFYLTREDGIEVIRVLHGARDIPSLFPADE